MCGIAGILARYAVKKETLFAMLQMIRHRGPDDEGIWQNDDQTISFGHRRLSIIDTSSHGHQPMVDAQSGLTITFNGEIYNYQELRQVLQACGHCFQTQTDTEVILKAYAEWGTDCVSHLNGMFAFSIYDSHQNQLFWARDRFGEKPFLFVHKDSFIAFASEYKALLSMAAVFDDHSDLNLLEFLWFSHGQIDNGRQTLFNDIQQLLPGECAVVDCNTLAIRIRRYWQITEFESVSIGFEEACDQFYALFKDSVKLRLRADVPVGSCLSGGLDSSSIVSMARELQGYDQDYHVFTGRFPNTTSDEWQYASQVIAAKQVTSHVVEPTAAGFLEDIERFIVMNELPVASTSQYAQWKVFELAKQVGVTVLLDGQGADELLGGYEQYFNQYIQDTCRLKGLREALQERKAIGNRYPAAFLTPRQTLQGKIPAWLKKWLGDWLKMGSDFGLGLNPLIAKHILQNREEGHLLAGHHLKSVLYQDCFKNSLSTLLRYGDRNSMAHSREVRLPFCDHRLAEFIFKLPVDYLMGQQQTKQLLRSSMSNLLPQAIAQRWNKQGFLPPQIAWMQGALGDAMAEVFWSRAFCERGYWNVKWWQQAYQRMRQGDVSLGWVLWKGFIAEQWISSLSKSLSVM